VQGLPFDLRTALKFFRPLHAALGLLNINLADARRERCRLALADGPGAPDRDAELVISYAPAAGEDAAVRSAIRRFKRVLWALGCFVPPGMTRLRPMGSSVHYAGTLPHSAVRSPLTTSRDGRSHDFSNLTVVDGSVFPSLPAKQLTFTMMANAARIAEHFDERGPASDRRGVVAPPGTSARPGGG
jgi:choline dehydrogenase-like flavoprotein